MAKSFHILILLFLLQTIASTQTNSDWPQTEARLTALLTGNSEQKRTALAEIRSLRTEQASRLAVPALRDGDEIVRATAAAAVVFLPESKAAAALLPLLDDKRPFVRREAVYALGSIGNWKATGRLRRLLSNDRDLEVRAAAAVAVGNIGDYSALDDLVNILKKRPTEQEEFLRRSAAHSIGQIFELYATGRTSAPTPQNFLPSKFKELGSPENMKQLYRQTDIDAITTSLSRVLRSQNEAADTRREAAFALGASRQPAAAAVLRSNLTSPDPYLAEISKEALLKIENQE